MKFISHFFTFMLSTINLFLAILMAASAFSPYIDPTKHPVLACFGLTFPVFFLLNLLFIVFWIFFKKRYALISLLAFLACGHAVRICCPLNMHKETPPESFKLLSYNVMAFANDIKHTQESPNPVLAYLLESDADIICIQEFIEGSNKYQLRKADIHKALKDYPYRTYQHIGTNTNGLACYSRFPILSQQPIPYESLYNGSAMYQLNINGDTVVIINNHLESNKLTIQDKKIYVDMIKDPKKEKVKEGTRLIISKLAQAGAIRAQQAKIISHLSDSLKQIGRTFIICGDFNDTPISYTYRKISEGLNDAFVQSGNGMGISYNQKGFYFRIDNILLSKNLEAYHCEVNNSIKDSDHYPILCHIAYRTNEQ